MAATIEVFADINYPFTHVGLEVIAADIEASNTPVALPSSSMALGMGERILRRRSDRSSDR